MTIADATSAARPPKLPFWRTVGRAYAAPFANFGSLLSAAWLWFLLLTPLVLVMNWFLVPLEVEFFAKLAVDPFGWPSPQFQLLLLLEQLVLLPAIASIAVAWHRLILTQERPSGVYMRFDRSVWLYVAYLLAVSLFLSFVQHLPQIVESAQGMRVALWVRFLPSVVAIAALFVFSRLSLVLPPIALGRTDIGLGDAWRATRGNTWRLACGPVVCMILMVVPGVLTHWLLGSDRMIAAIGMTLTQLFSILVGLIGVGFLSFAYQHFFEEHAA